MELRPHQIKAVEMLRQSLRAGNKRPVLAAPCSFGKTITAAYMLSEAAKKGKRGIFICDRVKLVQQALEAFDYHGLRVGVMQGDHERTNPAAPIQIASIQTITRRGRMPEFDFAIVDECFPAGTLISTPKGNIPIELVRPSMKVHNAFGVGEVLSATAKTTSEIVEIILNDGSRIKCTGNHKVFTDTGWVEARHLEVSSRVFGKKELSRLWGDYVACNCSGCNVREGCGISVEEQENLLSILLEEAGESYAQQSVEKKDERDIKAYRSQAEESWRKWSRANCSAGSDVKCSWIGLGCGACNTNKDKTLEQRPNTKSLQGRFGQQEIDDNHRARRWKSLHDQKKAAGCKKGFCSRVLRVESVEITKLRSNEVVYNIGISGHPSYFANGILVHNCHTHYKGLQDMMDAYTAVPFIGLSATPYSKGLGKAYDDLVVPITPRELLDQGYLCPVDYYGGAHVDLSKVKTKRLGTGGSDYDPDDLSRAVEDDPKLTGDIIQNWFKYAKGKQTIAFSPSIRHSKHMVDMFNAAGIPAVHIDGYMDDEERQWIYKAHDEGEFLILSCSRLLNTGYDAPQVECLIDCFSTRSITAYVQRAGRIMRTFKGKERAIYLDHASNVQRFGFAEDIIPDMLDDGEKTYNERSLTKEKKEPKVKQCPQCYQQMIGIRCKCGYEIPIKEQLESTKEELVKLQKVNNKEYTYEDKVKWLSELRAYGRWKNYKDGWAANKYREKFGVWPNKVNPVSTMQISKEVQAWITHTQIKSAKRRMM